MQTAESTSLTDGSSASLKTKVVPPLSLYMASASLTRSIIPRPSHPVGMEPPLPN